MKHRRKEDANKSWNAEREILDRIKSCESSVQHILLLKEAIEGLEDMLFLWAGGRRSKTSAWTRAYSIYGGWDISAGIKLSKQDSISSLLPILEYLDNKYEFSHSSDSPTEHKRIFYFSFEKGGLFFSINLTVHFKSSFSCRIIPTGKTTVVEETRVECIYV